MQARRLAARALVPQFCSPDARVGLPICVLDKEDVKPASHLASGVVERRHPAVATRHVRKDNGLFSHLLHFVSDSIYLVSQ
jgi:hypothetical protein